MIVNVRRSVFETNSSTNHTYTFALHPKSISDKSCHLFRTALQKAALVRWLFEEIGKSDDAFLLSGFCLDTQANICSPSSFGDAFTETLYSLCPPEDAGEEAYLAKIRSVITENEAEFYRDPYFSYSSKLKDTVGDIGADTLSDAERRTLALKAALFILHFGNDFSCDDMLSVFFEITEKRIRASTFLTGISSILDSQLVGFGQLRAIFDDLCIEICGMTAQQINEKIGYIGFDPLLSDSYSHDVLSSELQLDTDSYRGFGDSLVRLLTDESIVISAQ